MFHNIGSKIKVLAKAVCYIGIAFSCTIGIVILFFSRNEPNLYGLLIAGVGSFASWIGSLFAYGFGQLIENSDILAAQYCMDADEDETEYAPQTDDLVQ